MKPYSGDAMYGPLSTGGDATTRLLARQGREFLDSIKDVVVLDEVRRQDTKDPMHVPFSRFLRHLRYGQVDLQDWQWFNSPAMQLRGQTPAVQREYMQALAVFPQWVDLNKTKAGKRRPLANSWNAARNEELGVPLVSLKAQHGGSGHEKLVNHTAEAFDGLKADSGMVGVGSRIILDKNEWVGAGLANGTAGIVLEILFHPQRVGPEDLPEVLVVQWESNFKAPGMPWKCPTTGVEMERVAPIGIRTHHCNLKGKGRIWRRGFLVRCAQSMCVGKMQGATVDGPMVAGICDLCGSSFPAQCEYIICSRCRRAGLGGMLFEAQVPFHRIGHLRVDATGGPIKNRKRDYDLRGQKLREVADQAVATLRRYQGGVMAIQEEMRLEQGEEPLGPAAAQEAFEQLLVDEAARHEVELDLLDREQRVFYLPMERTDLQQAQGCTFTGRFKTALAHRGGQRVFSRTREPVKKAKKAKKPSKASGKRGRDSGPLALEQLLEGDVVVLMSSEEMESVQLVSSPQTMELGHVPDGLALEVMPNATSGAAARANINSRTGAALRAGSRGGAICTVRFKQLRLP